MIDFNCKIPTFYCPYCGKKHKKSYTKIETESSYSHRPFSPYVEIEYKFRCSNPRCEMPVSICEGR